MKYLSVLTIMAFIFLFSNCAITENTPAEVASVGVTGNDFSKYRSLANYLRTLPGVQVTGAGNNVNVQIRGTSSFDSETRPLYVVDGSTMGNSYAEVNRSIDMSEVSSVRVLMDSEAASYGVRGSNGVIEITLKR